MKEVNALKIRNNLGEILDYLSRTGEPVLVSKGRKLRAVLVTPEDFERRFLDFRAKEAKKRLLDELRGLRKKKGEPTDSLEVLRRLRGYDACYAALAQDLKGCWLTFDEKAHVKIEKERISCLLSEGLPDNW